MKKSEWQFEDWLLLIGGAWLLTKIFNSTKKAGIGSLPGANRKFLSYTLEDGTNIIDKELKKLNNQDAGKFIRLIIEARLAPEFKMPLYKRFVGNKHIDGELRNINDGTRIFVKKIGEEQYLILSFYKKQSNKTPQNEIDKAEGRSKEFGSRR